MNGSAERSDVPRHLASSAHRPADADYTDVFEQGGDTEAITRAAARIDQVLANDPDDQGESRDDYERVLIVDPLTVVFEVFQDERVVLILDLVYHPRPH